MTLGEYYSNKQWKQNESQFLQAKKKQRQEIKNRLKENKKTQAQIKKLKSYLQASMYPTKNKKGNSNFDSDLVVKAYEKISGKVLQDFDYGSQLKVASTSNNSLQIIREKYDHLQHKQSIELNTILTRLNKVQQKLEELTNLKNLEQADTNINEIENNLKQLEGILKQLLNNESHGVNSYGNAIFDLTKDENIKNLVNQMNEIYKAVSIAPITPTDYGDLLELTLGLLSDEMANHLVNKSVDEIVKNFADKTLKNSGPILGAQHISGDAMFKMEEFFVKEIKTEGVQVNGDLKQNINLGDFSISSNAGSSRQGKIDVQLTLKDISNSPFRISAKNWGSMGDFGENNLWYTLNRTIDSKTANHLIYSLGGKHTKENTLKSAHDLIRYCILLDGVMGYSQKNNWVDTLVINDRSKKDVIVEYLPDILDKAYNGIYDKITPQYDSGIVRTNSRKAMQDLPRVSRSATFKMRVISEYINTKVMAKYHRI